MLTQAQKQFWDQNGYLVLPKFFSDEQLAPVIQLHRTIWDACPSHVVVDDLVTGRRCYMSALSEAEKKHPFKVNDLYLSDDVIRNLSLDRQLTEVLNQLLVDAPVLCNSLSLDYGTQQSLHVDSLYMTPVTEGSLAATWIALEDCHPDAGPLRYLPGSQHIPLYRFSDGGVHEIVTERSQWEAYMQQQVNAYGLQEETFLPQKGDVFIWHANFLHGGSAIANPQLTRKSLVSHYFTRDDCLALRSRLFALNSGYWMYRPPLQVSEEVVAPPVQTKVRLSSAKHILRTTLHYFRLWKRNVFHSPQ